MKKTIYLLAGLWLSLLLISCTKKEHYDPVAVSNAFKAKQAANFILTDYYPDSFYHDYAMMNLYSDSANLNLQLTANHGFKFKKVEVLSGDLDHLKKVLSNYTTPPLNVAGPTDHDYIQEYPTGNTECKIIIPISTIKQNNVFVYVWAYVERYNTDGTLKDWRGIWIKAGSKVNNDQATTYIEY